MQQYRTVRSLQEDLDFLGLGEKKKNTNPVIAGLTEDIGQYNSLFCTLNPRIEEEEGTYTPKYSSSVFKTKVFKSNKDANDYMEKNKGWGVIGTEGEDGKPEYKVHVALNADKGQPGAAKAPTEMQKKLSVPPKPDAYNKVTKMEAKEPKSAESLVKSIMSKMAIIEKGSKKTFEDLYPKLEPEIWDAIDSKNVAKLSAVIKKLDDVADGRYYIAGPDHVDDPDDLSHVSSRLVGESIDLDEAVKVQKMHRMKPADRSKARRDYRAKRSKIKRAVKKLHKKSAWKKKHKKFIKMKHGRKAGARKRFIMAGIDSIASMAEGLNRGLVNLQEQTLNKPELISVFESIGGICNKFNTKILGLFEDENDIRLEPFDTKDGKTEYQLFYKNIAKGTYSTKEAAMKAGNEELKFDNMKASIKKYKTEESPEEKKVGYDLTYVGKDWDELDDMEDDNGDLDQDFDFTAIGDDWDELDDHEDEGDEVDDDDYEDENDKDYVGAEESVMMDMRCMQNDAAEVSKRLQEGTITAANAKDIFIGMVNHIIESAKTLTTAMEEAIQLEESIEDEIDIDKISSLPYSSSKDPNSIYAAMNKLIEKYKIGKGNSKKAYESVAKYKMSDSQEDKLNAKKEFYNVFENAKRKLKESTEYNYVGQDDIDDEDGKPVKPDSNAGKYVGKGGEPKDQEGKPEKAAPNEYVGKDAPQAEKQKPVAPESNAGKYVDAKGEPEAVKQSPAKVDSNAGKYIDSKGEPDEENEKLDLEISTKGKHVGDEPFGKLINKTVPVIEAKSLRSVKVTFSDGSALTTSMAAHLSDEEIKEYYKVGKEFNLGHGDKDKKSKVSKVEILGDMSEAKEDLLSKAKEYVQNGGAYNASIKDFKEWLAKNPNATWKMCKEFLDESHSEESMDADHDTDSLSRAYGESNETLHNWVDIITVSRNMGFNPKTINDIKNILFPIGGEQKSPSIKDIESALKQIKLSDVGIKTFLSKLSSKQVKEESDNDLDPVYVEQQSLVKYLNDKTGLDFKKSGGIQSISADIPNSHGFRINVKITHGTETDFDYDAFLFGQSKKDMKASNQVDNKSSLVKEIKKLLVGFGKEIKEDNKYVGQDKPNAEKDSPEKPESNKGKYVDTKGEPGEEDEKLDADSMKGKHVGEKQVKEPKEVPVIEAKREPLEKLTPKQSRQRASEKPFKVWYMTPGKDGRIDGDYATKEEAEKEAELLRKEFSEKFDETNQKVKTKVWIGNKDQDIPPAKTESIKSPIDMINEEVIRIMGGK